MNPRLSLFSAMVIVGSSVVVGKAVTLSMPVYTASFIRFFIGSIVLLIFMYAKEGGFSKFTGRDFMFMLLLGVTGSYGFNIFVLLGLKTIKATEAGLITGTAPVVFALIASFLLKEKISGVGWLGIVMSFSGILILNINKNGVDTESLVKIGSFYVSIAVLCEALFLLLRKFISKNASSLTVSFMVSVSGMFLFLPQSVMEIFDKRVIDFNLWNIIILFYYGAFITSFSYILWFSGINKLSAEEASPMTGVLPVSSVLLSFIFLGEKIYAQHILGCLFVAFGVMITSGFNPFKKSYTIFRLFGWKSFYK